jgi:hypothetical protein
MFKKIVFYWILGCFSCSVVAKEAQPTCSVQPNYDIIIMDSAVEFVGHDHIMTLSNSGKLQIDNQYYVVNDNNKQKMMTFLTYLRTELPVFRQLSHQQLNNVHNNFAMAIEKRLGNDAHLLTYLNQLYTELNLMLEAVIYNDNNQLIFKHTAFNSLKEKGRSSAARIFKSALADSLLHFKVFKDYSAIKKISANEWKKQKTELKAFNLQVCKMIEEIDNQYKQLVATSDIN